MPQQRTRRPSQESDTRIGAAGDQTPMVKLPGDAHFSLTAAAATSGHPSRCQLQEANENDGHALYTAPERISYHHIHPNGRTHQDATGHTSHFVTTR